MPAAELQRLYSRCLRRTWNNPFSNLILNGHPIPDGGAERSDENMTMGYEHLMVNHDLERYFGGSGFFNMGYWTAQTSSQADACLNLMDLLIAATQSSIGTGNIADAGCGLGATSNYLAKRFPNTTVTGINISAEQLLQGSRTYFVRPNAHAAVMDACEFALIDGSFQTVVSVEAAFHFPSRSRFFKECFRILADDGQLLMTDLSFTTETPDAIVSPVPRGNAMSTKDDYAGHLKMAGFDSVEITDISAQCVQPFFDSIISYLRLEAERGVPNARELRRMADAASYVKGRFNNYFLVSALKQAHKPG
jgi:SAM-dependent methyltransferase